MRIVGERERGNCLEGRVFFPHFGPAKAKGHVHWESITYAALEPFTGGIFCRMVVFRPSGVKWVFSFHIFSLCPHLEARRACGYGCLTAIESFWDSSAAAGLPDAALAGSRFVLVNSEAASR